MRRIAPLVFVLALAACMMQPVERPSVTLAPARDPAAVEAALLKALQNRGWLAQKEGPGTILATLNIRTHQIVSRITYSGASLHVEYVSSQNMEYAKTANGKEEIHRNYNGWVANVIRDTQTYLEGKEPDTGFLVQQKS